MKIFLAVTSTLCQVIIIFSSKVSLLLGSLLQNTSILIEIGNFTSLCLFWFSLISLYVDMNHQIINKDCCLQYCWSCTTSLLAGICSTLPISWTVKVPSRHQMLLTLSNMSFSCPSLHLNIRNGLLPTDTILYQVMSKTILPARIQSSSSILRLELQADQPYTDLHTCYVVIHFTATLTG